MTDTNEEDENEIPRSAAEICSFAAEWLDIFDDILKTRLHILEPDPVKRSPIEEILDNDSVQQDLRHLAEWFKARPHSNKDAWMGTNAYKEAMNLGENE